MAREAEYKRYDDCGPGGRKCPCCGPSPRQRKRHDRTLRRIEKRVVHQELRRELVDFMENGNVHS